MKRILITHSASGIEVDYMDEGIVVEIRYLEADPPIAREFTAVEEFTVIPLECDIEWNYRRADHARPEFDDYSIPREADEESDL